MRLGVRGSRERLTARGTKDKIDDVERIGEGRERSFKNGELRSRSRESIFEQRWQCAWQFAEGPGEDCQVEEGRGQLQDGNGGVQRGIQDRKDCCMKQCVLVWHGFRDSWHTLGDLVRGTV